MPEQYMDSSDVFRRPGSLILPPGFVCSLPPFEGSPDYPSWSDADIRKVVTDTHRPTMESLMPSKKWVKNQRSTSACNTYTSASMYQAARFLRGIKDGYRASGTFPYTFINGGRDQGSQLLEALVAGMKYGYGPEFPDDTERLYPNQVPKDSYKVALAHKSLGAYRVMTLRGLRTALAARYQVAAAVHCGPNWGKRRDGIQGVQKGPGNHAIHVRDIILDGKRFRYPSLNSWGVDFGDDGSTDLIDEHFEGTMPYHAFYAIPTTAEG